VATASEDSTARIWSVKTGESLTHRALGGGGALTSLAFNPSGTLLAATARNGNVRLWRVPTGELDPGHNLRPHRGVVRDAAFSDDGRWLVTAGPSRMSVLRVSTGQRLKLLRGSKTAFTSIAFSPRGWRILAGGEDGSVGIYECRLCSRLPGLVALGRERLEQVKPRH